MKNFLFVATFVSCFFVAQYLFAQQIPAQPNIIHIIADDMGWTDLSSDLTNLGNGSEFYQTPNIDRLAQEGLSFTSAYAMPTCVPTRMAIMTGQSAARTRSYAAGSIAGEDELLVAPENITSMSNTLQTVGETLQGAGYNTAHIGKFHITRNEGTITRQHGFDVNIGGASASNPGSYFPTQQSNEWTYHQNVSETMDVFAEPYTEAYINEQMLPFANGADTNTLIGTPKHISDATADAAIEYLQGQVGSDEPFYMNLAFHAVHTPIEPRSDLLAKYEGIVAANGGNSPDARHRRPQYAALLEGMDQAIGRVLAYLENPDGDDTTEDSMASNTMLIFYGDNGGGLAQTSNSPLLRGKGALDEGGIRVPMIAYMPGTINGGTVTSELVQATDFYPTFTELGQGTLPSSGAQPMDGVSLNELFRGEEAIDRSAIYYHFPGYTNSISGPTSMAIVEAGDRQYKLNYRYTDRSLELYELTSDIGERINLVDATMTEAAYKEASKAIGGLRDYLDTTGADYPTTLEGRAVPPPSHLPPVTIEPNSAGETLHLGIRLVTDTGGGGTTFTVAQDVMLKALEVDRSMLSQNDSVSIEFLQGDNPFASLSGYDAEGLVLEETSMTVTGTRVAIANLEFGVLGQDEILLTAGTTLRVTTGSGNQAPGIESLVVAQPIEALPNLLLDATLDGQLDGLDLDRICAAVHTDSASSELDQDGDSMLSLDDVQTWLTATGHLNGDADLDGEVAFLDFLALSQNFSTDANWSQGDFDCDGSVTFTDFLTLSQNFGQSFPGGASHLASVPEPSAVWGVAGCCFALVSLRRKRTLMQQ